MKKIVTKYEVASATRTFPFDPYFHKTPAFLAECASNAFIDAPPDDAPEPAYYDTLEEALALFNKRIYIETERDITEEYECLISAQKDFLYEVKLKPKGKYDDEDEILEEKTLLASEHATAEDVPKWLFEKE